MSSSCGLNQPGRKHLKYSTLLAGVGGWVPWNGVWKPASHRRVTVTEEPMDWEAEQTCWRGETEQVSPNSLANTPQLGSGSHTAADYTAQVRSRKSGYLLSPQAQGYSLFWRIAQPRLNKHPWLLYLAASLALLLSIKNCKLVTQHI